MNLRRSPLSSSRCPISPARRPAAPPATAAPAPARTRAQRQRRSGPWHSAGQRGERRRPSCAARRARRRPAACAAGRAVACGSPARFDAAQFRAAAVQRDVAHLGGERRVLRGQHQCPVLARAVGGDAVMLLEQRAIAGQQRAEAGLQSAQFRSARQRESCAALAAARDGDFAGRGSWWFRRRARALRAPAWLRRGRRYSP